jgi:hypothetical protein
VRGPEAAEVVPLHGAREALADRRAGHVDELAGEVVRRDDLLAHADQGVRVHPELHDLALGLDLRLGEVAAHGLAGVLGLGGAGAELDGGIAILLDRALRHDLNVVELEDGHRDLLAVFQEQAGHAHLLCDHARTEHRHLLRP